jgi:hypothetical protein
MRIHEGFSNSPTLANLGLARTKADILLRLGSDEREAFVEENNVEELSVRELENRVCERAGEKTEKIR